MDFHLGLLVKEIPSYIKDTTHFLLKLRALTNLPPETMLATLDVTSLYTNIPHSEGIEACRTALNSRRIRQPPTDDLIHLIKLILTRNSFVFGEEHYLQLRGTAMGTVMAPSYANIFMGKLETTLLERAPLKPSVWWRYIDDVFVIWPHGEECFEQFVDLINSMHPTIKFTAEWSKTSISFLDVRVTLHDGGRITTDLYTKPTDMHQYLHRQSCHPRHTKVTIPYSQALRLRRICSEPEEYLERTRELKCHLINRGYGENEVQQQINKATRVHRDEALMPSETTNIGRIPLVVTYHPNLPPLHKILRKHLPILHLSDRMKKAVSNPPLVANRRPRNLNDLVVRASLKPPQQYRGNYQCGRPRCKTCKHIKTGNNFTSTARDETFFARVTATCKSANIVYLIECLKCKKQYVGETENALHLRMNGHRSDYYRKLADKPVAAHFNEPCHSFEHLSVMVIEQMGSADTTRRKLRESYWIHTLGSLTPHGLNLDS